MKPLLLFLLLTLPIHAQQVRIRQKPVRCPVIFRDGLSYCPLLALAQNCPPLALGRGGAAPLARWLVGQFWAQQGEG